MPDPESLFENRSLVADTESLHQTQNRSSVVDNESLQETQNRSSVAGTESLQETQNRSLVTDIKILHHLPIRSSVAYTKGSPPPSSWRSSVMSTASQPVGGIGGQEGNSRAESRLSPRVSGRFIPGKTPVFQPDIKVYKRTRCAFRVDAGPMVGHPDPRDEEARTWGPTITVDPGRFGPARVRLGLDLDLQSVPGVVRRSHNESDTDPAVTWFLGPPIPGAGDVYHMLDRLWESVAGTSDPAIVMPEIMASIHDRDRHQMIYFGFTCSAFNLGDLDPAHMTKYPEEIKLRRARQGANQDAVRQRNYIRELMNQICQLGGIPRNAPPNASGNVGKQRDYIGDLMRQIHQLGSQARAPKQWSR